MRYSAHSEVFSVTAVKLGNEFNSLWLVNSAETDVVKNYDDAVRCGDIISLEHVTSKKNLMTNTDSPMLSNNYTVGCVEKPKAKIENNSLKVDCVNQAAGSVVQG